MTEDTREAAWDAVHEARARPWPAAVLTVGIVLGVSLAIRIRRLGTWLGRYRVWEANRKTFPYPENWMEPYDPGSGD
jgi:hypothetical protein